LRPDLRRGSNDPSYIQSMLTDNGNGTYGVRFYFNGHPIYVTVNNQLAYSNGSLTANNSNYMWSNLLEKAFVQLHEQPEIAASLGHEAGNAYYVIEGGAPIR